MQTKHNNLFIELFTTDKKITNIRNTIIANLDIDNNCQKYIYNLDLFISTHKIEIKNINNKVLYTLVYNYWYTLLIYYKQRQHDTQWSDKTLWPFLISSIRILELTIFLLHKNNDKFISLFLDTEADTILFNHFETLMIDLDKYIFSIGQDKKDKKRIKVYIQYLDKYKSNINISERKASSKSGLSWFEYYFKLDNKYVKKIINLEESENTINGRNSKGQKGKHVPFEDINLYEKNSFSHGNIDKEDFLKENFNESIVRDNKIVSIQLNNQESSTDIIIRNSTKYVIESPYKNYYINNAIGNNIAKRNMSLPSTYNMPHIELLKIFITNLLNNNSNDHRMELIYLSIMLGISVEKIIYIMLDIDKDIRYYKQSTKLSIKISDDIFATNINNETTRSINFNEADLYLMDFLKNLWINSSIFIHNNINIKVNNDNINKQVQAVTTEVSNFLSISKKKFYKNITITIKSLPSYIKHYYKIYTKNSNINLLFIGYISKSDRARVCYVSQRKRLLAYENWINTFHAILTNKPSNIKNISIKDEEWIGSPRFIKANTFKTFIKNLDSLECKNELDRVNVQMIFMRYAFSISLATRNFNNSCNLDNYSNIENIIILQEKNKSLKTSKRIIPLTTRATKYIQLFYILKEKYQIDSFSPVILIKKKNITKEYDMSKNNILKFIKSIATCEQYRDVENFITYSSINFGRHIFSTYAATSNIKSEYIDAFLNHFKYGLADQGIYSNFDNKTYKKEIVSFIAEIEDNYFPKYINLELIND